MTNPVCPLNNRTCHCDPAIEKLRPCVLTRRIAKLIRSQGSTSEEEALNATRLLRQLLPAEGLDFNDISFLIENCDSRIEQLKYSDSDMANVAERMKERGQQQGYQKAKAENSLPPKFYDESGEPRWYELADFTAKFLTKFKPGFEQDFVESMPAKMLGYGKPRTAKQAHWILVFFRRVGGTVPAGIEFDGERIS